VPGFNGVYVALELGHWYLVLFVLLGGRFRAGSIGEPSFVVGVSVPPGLLGSI